jgi:hypothetical protein
MHGQNSAIVCLCNTSELKNILSHDCDKQQINAPEQDKRNNTSKQGMLSSTTVFCNVIMYIWYILINIFVEPTASIFRVENGNEDGSSSFLQNFNYLPQYV